MGDVELYYIVKMGEYIMNENIAELCKVVGEWFVVCRDANMPLNVCPVLIINCSEHLMSLYRISSISIVTDLMLMQ